jgi:anti-anti-sigma factor
LVFNIERSGDRTILTVWQNLDIVSQIAFERILGAIAESAARRIIVSLEHCAYCDSTGVNVLLRSAGRLGSRLTVVVAPETLSRRVFETCRVQKLMPVVATMREALEEPIRRTGASLAFLDRSSARPVVYS